MEPKGGYSWEDSAEVMGYRAEIRDDRAGKMGEGLVSGVGWVKATNESRVGGLDSVQRPGMGGDTEGAPGLVGAIEGAEAEAEAKRPPP